MQFRLTPWASPDRRAWRSTQKPGSSTFKGCALKTPQPCHSVCPIRYGILTGVDDGLTTVWILHSDKCSLSARWFVLKFHPHSNKVVENRQASEDETEPHLIEPAIANNNRTVRACLYRTSMRSSEPFRMFHLLARYSCHRLLAQAGSCSRYKH